MRKGDTQNHCVWQEWWLETELNRRFDSIHSTLIFPKEIDTNGHP